jgi:hypothetical protein
VTTWTLKISAISSGVQCLELSIFVSSNGLVYWIIRANDSGFGVLLDVGGLSDVGYGKGQYGKKRLPYGQIIDGER